MICLENDDPTAELLATCFDSVGLDSARTITSNAYPWYINRTPSAGELEAGAPPLRRLVRLLPDLKVVLLMGRKADDGWRRYKARYPDATASIRVMPTMHPSSRGITGGGQMSRADGIARLSADLREATMLIG